MAFKKVADKGGWVGTFYRCEHPEHNPSNMTALEPGTYEWACPSCGNVTTVVVGAINNLTIL